MTKLKAGIQTQQNIMQCQSEKCEFDWAAGETREMLHIDTLLCNFLIRDEDQPQAVSNNSICDLKIDSHFFRRKCHQWI